MSCRGFLQCLMKLFNFILALVGVLMVVYSFYMLNEYGKDGGSPSPSPPPEELSAVLKEGLKVSGGETLGAKLSLRGPWFIYAFLGAGCFIILVTLIGAIAAEIHNACCLSFYQFGLAIILLLQGMLAAGIFLDKSWEKDLPDDPTGELQKTKDLILKHLAIIKWSSLAIIIVEVVALLLAMVLRAMHDSSDNEPEDVYDNVDGRQPLLPKHAPPAADSPSLEPAQVVAPRGDAWRSRMLEKE